MKCLVLFVLLLAACSKPGTTVVVLPSKQSLLRNSGFEQGTVGYQFTGSGNYQILPTAAYSGLAGLRLFKMSVEPSPENLPLIVPGKSYMIGFWARLVSHVPNGATEEWPAMIINTGFSNGSDYISESANQVRIFSGEWTRYEYIFQPGQRAGYTWKLQLSFTSSLVTDNIVDLDEIMIEDVIIQ